MSELKLFEGNSLANSDLFKSLQQLNSNLIGNSFGTSRRISVRGSRFREIVNGEQVAVSKDDTMNIVIIDAAKIHRTYYEGSYDPDVLTAPTCWSANTEAPDDDVPEDQVQASRCADCKMNIKGSGQGESRACRFSQRLAVVIEGKLDTVYQLQIAATSIFGDAKGSSDKMPMQKYARFLEAHNTPAIAVVTEMSFDEDADTPKLFFKPLRALTEDELEAVVKMREHEDTKKAITMKVFETDKVLEKIASDAPKQKAKVAKNAAKAEAKKEVEVEEEAVPEPTKVEKKKAPEPIEDDLAALVADWDDE